MLNLRRIQFPQGLGSGDRSEGRLLSPSANRFLNWLTCTYRRRRARRLLRNINTLDNETGVFESNCSRFLSSSITIMSMKCVECFRTIHNKHRRVDPSSNALIRVNESILQAVSQIVSRRWIYADQEIVAIFEFLILAEGWEQALELLEEIIRLDISIDASIHQVTRLIRVSISRSEALSDFSHILVLAKQTDANVDMKAIQPRFALLAKKEYFRTETLAEFARVFDLTRSTGLFIEIESVQAHLDKLMFTEVLQATSLEDVEQIITIASRINAEIDSKIKTQIARTSIRLALGGGREVDHKSPLLDPKIFEEFIRSKNHAGSLYSRLPSMVQVLIRASQFPRTSNAPARVDSDIKVLFVTDNWNFSETLVRSLKRNGFELRFIHFNDFKRAVDIKAANEHRVSYQIRAFGDCRLTKSQMWIEADESFPVLSKLIDWCDVVFCEWWTHPATFFSRFLDGSKSLVVRCHSFEAFYLEPFYTNLRGVDGVIFIADHIRKIFNEVFDGAIPSEFETAVIENLRDYSQLTVHQRTEAERFTLGMTQYASANKDPILAIEILEKLRSSDRRWRIRFVGDPWPDDLSSKEADYANEFNARVAELGDAVIIDQRTNDINSWLHGVGFILSTSHREGSHESLLEGMLTGAIPVLRRWPMVRQFGAPECVFPSVDTFDYVDEAVEYIVAANEDYHERSRRVHQSALQRVEGTTAEAALCEFLRRCHAMRRSTMARDVDEDHPALST